MNNLQFRRASDTCVYIAALLMQYSNFQKFGALFFLQKLSIMCGQNYKAVVKNMWTLFCFLKPKEKKTKEKCWMKEIELAQFCYLSLPPKYLLGVVGWWSERRLCPRLVVNIAPFSHFIPHMADRYSTKKEKMNSSCSYIVIPSFVKKVHTCKYCSAIVQIWEALRVARAKFVKTIIASHCRKILYKILKYSEIWCLNFLRAVWTKNSSSHLKNRLLPSYCTIWVYDSQ